MRQYHPTTLRILSERRDIPKRFSCSVWSEVFKWKASGQKHPKCIIDNNYALGLYLRLVYKLATNKQCSLDRDKIKFLSQETQDGFNTITSADALKNILSEYFDSNYLFSDACSLYFKGINIFPDIFGDEWRKYCPVISLKEIKRQVDKTLSK
jgi:hypothetical protein